MKRVVLFHEFVPARARRGIACGESRRVRLVVPRAL
jgi:hypothetical protein